MINWQLHAYDVDERRWLGFIDGQSEYEYWVHRGNCGCVSDPEFEDACDGEMWGINCCEAHHKYGSNWPAKISTDPLLFPDRFIPGGL